MDVGSNCKLSEEKKRANQALRQRLQEERKKVAGFREKPVLALYSQPFLYPIDGKLCPEGRGP